MQELREHARDAGTPVEPGPDVRIADHGSIVEFRPLTARARVWITEHVEGGALWYAGALAVERRYAATLARGMQADGMRVAV